MAPPLPVLHGLVLTGGHSTRMGEDKALIEYGDGPQLLATWRRIVPCVAGVFRFAACRSARRTRAQRATRSSLMQWTALERRRACLRRTQRVPQAAWLVVACDLPLLQASTLARVGECA